MYQHKTVFVTLSRPNPYGATRIILTYLCALCEQGYRIVLATGNDNLSSTDGYNSTLLQKLLSLGGTTILVPELSSVRYFQAQKKLKTAMKHYRADIAIASDALDFPYLLPAAAALKIPAIAFLQCLLEFEGILAPLKSITLTYPIRRFPAKVVAVSELAKNSIIKAAKIDNSLVSVVPNGISISEIPKVERSFCDSNQQATILLLGRVHKEKGQDTLIRALAVMKSRKMCTIPRVLIAGEATAHKHQRYLRDLLSMIQQNGLDEFVEFIGYQNDIRSLLQSVDLLVLPSRREGGFPPLSVLEAMANRVPVVMSDFGIPLTDTVSPALLFKKNCPDSLAMTLSRFIGWSTSQKVTQGDIGYQFINEARNESDSASSFVNIVTETMKQ